MTKKIRGSDGQLYEVSPESARKSPVDDAKAAAIRISPGAKKPAADDAAAAIRIKP